MYQLNLSEFTQEEFLRDYWQKKPVVIRQGFVDFQDPISADELAGFAYEETVQSRLVYKKDGEWQAEFGPFDSYERLGEKDWTLVVQALDNWSEDAAKMIEPFRFIPHWRLDDLMVSFGAPGGGVGPHIDLYDVFICQGVGSRRWRVGDRGEHREFAAHAALLHVDPFEPIIDVELQTGDILYIPPGFPHDGITLTDSLSFSVGFRTNSTMSLFSGFADHLIDKELATELIEDPDRVACNHTGAIDNRDYLLIKNQMLKLFDNEEIFRNFAGCFLTQPKHELDLQPDDSGFSKEEMQELLAQKDLLRLGGLRAFYFTETVEDGICYINGEEVCFPAAITAAVKLLCNNVCISSEELAPWYDNVQFIEFIKTRVEAGYWYFSE